MGLNDGLHGAITLLLHCHATIAAHAAAQVIAQLQAAPPAPVAAPQPAPLANLPPLPAHAHAAVAAVGTDRTVGAVGRAPQAGLGGMMSRRAGV